MDEVETVRDSGDSDGLGERMIVVMDQQLRVLEWTARGCTLANGPQKVGDYVPHALGLSDDQVAILKSWRHETFKSDSSGSITTDHPMNIGGTPRIMNVQSVEQPVFGCDESNSLPAFFLYDASDEPVERADYMFEVTHRKIEDPDFFDIVEDIQNTDPGVTVETVLQNILSEGDFLGVVDRRGSFLDWSRLMEWLTGFTKKDVIGCADKDPEPAQSIFTLAKDPNKAFKCCSKSACPLFR